MKVKLINQGKEHLKSGMVDSDGVPVVRMADLSRDTQMEVIRHLMTA